MWLLLARNMQVTKKIRSLPIYSLDCCRRLLRDKIDKVKRLVEDLDTPSSDDKPSRKLRRGFEKEKPKRKSQALVGYLESEAAEVCDILNECLASSKLAGIFKKIDNTSDVIEIEEVRLNQDLSQVYAFWSSTILNEFTTTLSASENDKNAVISSTDFKSRAKDYINERLQRAEPKFRAALARGMSFRFIPRVYFRPFLEPTPPIASLSPHKLSILRMGKGIDTAKEDSV